MGQATALAEIFVLNKLFRFEFSILIVGCFVVVPFCIFIHPGMSFIYLLYKICSTTLTISMYENITFHSEVLLTSISTAGCSPIKPR